MKAKYFLLYIFLSLPPFIIFYNLNRFAFLMLVLSINLLIIKFVSRFDIIITSNKKIKNLDNYDTRDYAPLLEIISDGVICVSQDRSILFQNVKLSRILNKKEIKLSSINELPSNIMHLLDTTFISSDTQVLKEYVFQDKLLNLKFTPILKSQDCTSVIISFIDISESKKNQKLKTELLTNISHEFKTPLTSIQGYSELLIENSKNLSQLEHKYLNKILKNSDKLISIYDNILNLSKVENDYKLSKSIFKLQDSLVSIFDTIKINFNNVKPRLKFNLEYEDLNVNKLLFERVIFNLFENSFKYSNDDLTIEVSALSEGPNKVIKFKDNGIGIPKDKQERIFERFYRINESRSSETQGLGLGLSIVKNIIEKHSGTIQIGKTQSGLEVIIILPS